jgi:hypothetical protein
MAIGYQLSAFGWIISNRQLTADSRQPSRDTTILAAHFIIKYSS